DHLSLSFVVLQCSLPPRDLVSFPTRRSSDLGLSRAMELKLNPPGYLLPGSSWRGIHSCVAADGNRNRSGMSPMICQLCPFTSIRSEEHTSELQSLRHLVCRLLLEKKKRNKKA